MKHLLLTIALLLSITSFAQSLETDRLALVALYNSTNGAGWANKAEWNPLGVVGESPCNWYGVTCSAGRVTKLELNDNNLIGTLPSEIGSLNKLTNLSLGVNKLNGSIPASIGNLTSLESLKLSENNISGTIPSEICTIATLQRLYLFQNQLSGNVPSQLENLSNLQILSLHKNQLTGFIPVELGNLSKLILLNLSDNKISGTIPVELGALKALGALNLEKNQLTGNIPLELGNLTLLQNLLLDENQLSGNIPGELGNLPYLYTLYLDRNQLTGSIPAQLGNLSSLGYLNLDHNKLSGIIPALSAIPESCTIDINDNKLTFDGMEGNISKLDYYSPQDKIPITESSSVLSVNAGGTMANNTYKWYKDGVLVATNSGTNNYIMNGFGKYHAEVTNSIATKLALISEEFNFQSPLPVTLVNFTGKHSEGRNILRWATTAETNNAGFEIQRSNDARTFATIGFIDGKGQSAALHNYQFTDNEPLPMSYYRLRQIDFDGKSDLSRTISINTKIQQLKIYPNPAKDTFTIESSETGTSIHIYNLKGSEMYAQKAAAVQTISINNWPTGIYIVKIGDNSEKIMIEE